VRAQVSVENSRIALDDTEVRAPVTGTVIEKNVEKGQVISSPTTDVGGGTVLLKMADLSSVQVKALVDETDIGKIQPGQDATVTVAAYPNQPFKGKVLKIEPKAEEELAVTMFSVLVTIDNEEGLLRPGMNAEVNVRIASALDVPAVPTMALRTRRDISASESYLGMEEGWISEQLKASEANKPEVAGDSSGYRFESKYWLLIEDESGLKPVYVYTGITDLDYNEVIAGVDAGDKIVMLPSSGLIESQERFREIMGDFGGVPGMKSKDEDKKKK
jgi:HlyD family secretion protein